MLRVRLSIVVESIQRADVGVMRVLFRQLGWRGTDGQAPRHHQGHADAGAARRAQVGGGGVMEDPPFFVPKAPPPDWDPDHHDADHPDYRPQFAPHDDADPGAAVTVLQFTVSMLEQRVSSLEALTSIQDAMLKRLGAAA